MQLTVRMSDEYNEKIVLLAKKMGLKRSDIVRIAIKEFIEERLPADQKKPYEKVRSLLGIAESGINDLGLNHREHIIKKIKKAS